MFSYSQFYFQLEFLARVVCTSSKFSSTIQHTVKRSWSYFFSSFVDYKTLLSLHCR